MIITISLNTCYSSADFVMNFDAKFYIGKTQELSTFDLQFPKNI